MPRLAASFVALLVLASIAPVAVSAAPSPVAREAAPATAAAATALEGIDVSHWQGTINWTKVAAAGKKFAIIKASEDVDFVDDHYVINRSQAQAAGIWTGAYHFARPDASANDAVAEADHFVDTMSLGVKDLIPALDLEDSGGLSVTALQSWVSAFMARVTTRIGIRPMIYVSPAFWKKYMGDTRSFADAGYRTLWIAHWGVSAPSVPASNWGGRGWTFWQYSNCGTVSGISGCVDLDKFNGADLMTQAYSIFRLTATSGSQVRQGRTAPAATVGIARTNFTSPVELKVSGLPAGATAAFDASPTTATASTMHVTTDAGSVKIGSYPLVVTGEGQGLKRSVRVTLVVADGIPPTVVGPSFWLEPGTTIGTSTLTARATWSASDPSGIWSYAIQRSVSGGAWSAVSLPSRTSTAVWQSLALGKVTRDQAHATDLLSNTSAWKPGQSVSALLTEQTAGSVRFTGSWTNQRTTAASGTSYRTARAAGAAVTYTFTGSSVGWVAARGPGRGYAKVYVDGAYAARVNLSSTRTQYRVVVFARNFGKAGPHTLKIVAEGTAGHPRVDVDGFIRLWVS